MNTDAPELVYFGDSLTDDGNLFDATQGVLPFFIRALLGGPTNAASDGPTHATYTADLTGLSSSNYAVGAARADGSYLLEDVITDFGLGDLIIVPSDDPALDFDINLDAQVDRFFEDVAGQDLSGTTAMVLIGANDYGTLETESETFLADAIAAITGVITGTRDAVIEMAGNGVGTVVISTLPPAEFFPEILSAEPDDFAATELVFDVHNAALEQMVNGLAQQGINVELLDTGAMAMAIAEDPTGFGLIAPYTLTQQDSDVLDDFEADQVAFWDGVHPTTATHGVLGAHNAHHLEGGEIAALTDASDRSVQGGTDDLVLGYGGADTVTAGDGDDIAFGGTGNDKLRGQSDADLMSGGAGNDTVNGGSGADILDGDGGDDLILGGRSADVIIDGLGSDIALGGGGNDVFVYSQAELIGGTTGTDSDFLDAGGGLDTLFIAVQSSDFETFSALSIEDVLTQLGVTVSGFEEITLVEGPAAQTEISGQSWFGEADVWGLI